MAPNLSKSNPRTNSSKAGAILSLFVAVGFIGVLIFSVQAFVLPTGSYGSTGPYDTLQCSDTRGRVQVFGGSLIPYSAPLLNPITIYNQTTPNTIGSCVDTLNINLAVKSGTTQGYSVTCNLSATINGTAVRTVPCRGGFVSGVVGATISPIQLTVSGSELYTLMVGSYLNKTGALRFTASGSLTVYFLQGCGSPPCGVAQSFSDVQLSTAFLTLSPSGAVLVNSVQGGQTTAVMQTATGGGALGGFCFSPTGSC